MQIKFESHAKHLTVCTLRSVRLRGGRRVWEGSHEHKQHEVQKEQAAHKKYSDTWTDVWTDAWEEWEENGLEGMDR